VNSLRYGEWAVVTGATDGIGKAIAKELSKKGMKVRGRWIIYKWLWREGTNKYYNFKERTKLIINNT
jgi:hypothetical protein